ncbi:hypothetical protein SKAU_G00255260 [Synaphobranchus kaupii]|uniref:Uncharacterized protein n=1 Tax=Synaphobranchus kaupii TaxID=118154 RepID=A0A9Q1F3U8_SYNKA|nr:hypothetical protein SKAU_G00255260 [Synaphobranchus kaupii]
MAVSGGTGHSWGLTLSVCPAMAITRGKCPEPQSCSQRRGSQHACHFTSPTSLAETQQPSPRTTGRHTQTGVSGPSPNGTFSLPRLLRNVPAPHLASPAPCSLLLTTFSTSSEADGEPEKMEAFPVGTSCAFLFLCVSCGAESRAVHHRL